MEAECASGSSSRSGSADRRKRAHSDSEGHRKEGAAKSAKRGKIRKPAIATKADFVKDSIEDLDFEEGLYSSKKFRGCREEIREATATDLAKEVESGIRTILGVAARSKNLKGTFTKALKSAALQIEEATVEMHGRTSSEESAILRAKNDRLQAEVADLREELAKLRAEVDKIRPREPLPSEGGENASVDILDAVLPAIGRMVDAKLAGLEDRLLPEKRQRPPLRADVATIVESPSPEESGSGSLQKPNPKTKSRSGRARDRGAKTAPLPPKPNNMDEDWTTVVKRGKTTQRAAAPTIAVPPVVATTKKAANKKQTVAAKTGASKPAGPAVPKSAVAKTGPKRRLRAPTSSAVVLTLQPGAAERGLSYKSVMSEAKARIKLESLGIVGGLKCRLAATGAYLLEVPSDGGEKADALAAALRAALDETDVRIARPVKCAELRLTGLDDSVSQEEIVAAVAAAGGCDVGSIKVGSIVRTPPVMGKVWLSCPVAAAKKVAEGGRFKIGWVIAQVALLDARPLRCYRCLRNGHVARGCTSDVDRSGFCFRCGQPGHKARDCGGSPHCVLCAELGKPTEHRAGSASCHGAKVPKGRKKRAVPRTQTAPVPSLATSPAATAAVEVMEAESIVTKD